MSSGPAKYLVLHYEIFHGEREMESLSEMTTGSADAFFGLSQVVLAKLILFNRKRQGEASKIKVEDYQKKGNQITQLQL